MLLLAYGVVVERFFILDAKPPIPAELRKLTDAWKGKRVGVLADIHLGMWLGNPGMARRAVRALLDTRPDVVLLAGDFVVRAGGEPARIDEAVSIVRPLVDAGIPTYAVLGNHDYSIFSLHDPADVALADRIAAALRGAGIVVLRNQSAPVRLDGGPPLYLVGVDSNWASRDDVVQALSGVPDDAPRIVFMHNPSSFPKLPAGAAPFAVAAHTHGGDVRVPGKPHWSWLEWLQGRKVPVDGWADASFGRAGNLLYVNRGIGNSTAPLRINDPPELTLFVLRGDGR